MEENENILEKAVKALKNEQTPPGPSQELADETISKLTEASGQSNKVTTGKRIWFIDWLKAPNSFTKVAAAAVLLIIAGYAAGRLTSPRQPDIEQLQATIRSRLRDEMKQYLQLALTSSYAQLKNELSQQYRSDLNQFAAYTLAASGAATNQLLEELIESINTAQTQDRQWVAAAFEQIEFNRLRDNAQLSDAFVTFAVQTEQDMARLWSYTQPDSSVPNESKNINP